MALNIEKYKTLILEEKARLEADRQTLRDSERTGEDVGDITTSDPNHPGDSATEVFEMGKDMALVAGLDAQLTQINNALDRIEAGTYGTCERCGKVIPEARLNAIPSATLCIEDQEYVERTQ
jgi:DnaK suppressor protein